MAAKRGYGRCLIFAIACATLLSVQGQTRLSLQEAGARKPESFTPAHEGEQVQVEGTAASRAIRLRDYSHLVIEDESNHGLTLDAPEGTLTGIEPGDRLEVQGTIFNRAGLAVLQPTTIR